MKISSVGHSVQQAKPLHSYIHHVGADWRRINSTKEKANQITLTDKFLLKTRNFNILPINNDVTKKMLHHTHMQTFAPFSKLHMAIRNSLSVHKYLCTPCGVHAECVLTGHIQWHHFCICLADIILVDKCSTSILQSTLLQEAYQSICLPEMQISCMQ